MSAKELHLDIESFSEADLRKVGVYKYAEHPSTRILTCSYRFGDEGPVSRWVPDEGGHAVRPHGRVERSGGAPRRVERRVRAHHVPRRPRH